MKLDILLLLITVACECKLLTRCKLAKELLKTRLVKKTFLPSYVCLIEKVSNRDTGLLIESPSSKKNYGIYQIPQKWCREKKPGGDCNIACESLLDDDIRDDTECAGLIVKREGFQYWQQYSRCKNDLKFYSEEIYKCPDLPKHRSASRSDNPEDGDDYDDYMPEYP